LKAIEGNVPFLATTEREIGKTSDGSLHRLRLGRPVAEKQT